MVHGTQYMFKGSTLLFRFALEVFSKNCSNTPAVRYKHDVDPHVCNSCVILRSRVLDGVRVYGLRC